MSLLGIAAIISTCIQGIKEAMTPTIPAENWANQQLIQQDMLKGIASKDFQKNLANGKYKITEKYEEPHRDKNGKIIIENCQLYKEDCKNCDPLQVRNWIQQGKYNLTPEELEKEKERIKKEFDYLYSLIK